VCHRSDGGIASLVGALTLTGIVDDTVCLIISDKPRRPLLPRLHGRCAAPEEEGRWLLALHRHHRVDATTWQRPTSTLARGQRRSLPVL
jgi:hypothetical protein